MNVTLYDSNASYIWPFALDSALTIYVKYYPSK